MAEYIDRNKLDIAFTDKCTGDCGCCQYWNADSYGHDCNLIHNFPPADVVEREKIDKAIEEIRGYARFHRDKIHNDVEQGKYLAYEKCIEILKRNIGEQ